MRRSFIRYRCRWRMTGRGRCLGASLGARERWALSISGGEGSVSLPNCSHSSFEKKSVGAPLSMDSGKPRIRMFCLLRRPSKSVSLAFSQELSSRRVEQMPSRSITRWLRSSAVSSRDETRWPWSSTSSRVWSSFETSWLNDVLNSVANATRCSSSSVVIAARVKVALASSFLPDLLHFEAIAEVKGLVSAKQKERKQNKQKRIHLAWKVEGLVV